MTKYIELRVETNPVWSEYLADILIKQIGCAGVVTEELEYKDEKITKSETNIVKGYLWLADKQTRDVKTIQADLWQERSRLIGMNINDPGSWNLHIKEVEDEEWAHSWKRFWYPQKIGTKIVICPSWEEYELQEGEIKIELDPGTAFGTGTHPTTRLCIRAIEKYLNNGNKIADIGTGSGILAVSGVKLGAASVIGVDNDPSVIEIAKENAAKNDTKDQSLFYEGSASDVNGAFELVVANILAEVIVDIMEDLLPLLKKEGVMILSGIIAEKADIVKQALFAKELEIVEVATEENWVAIIAQKKKDS